MPDYIVFADPPTVEELLSSYDPFAPSPPTPDFAALKTLAEWEQDEEPLELVPPAEPVAGPSAGDVREAAQSVGKEREGSKRPRSPSSDGLADDERASGASLTPSEWSSADKTPGHLLPGPSESQLAVKRRRSELTVVDPSTQTSSLVVDAPEWFFQPRTLVRLSGLDALPKHTEIKALVLVLRVNPPRTTATGKQLATLDVLDDTVAGKEIPVTLWGEVGGQIAAAVRDFDVVYLSSASAVPCSSRSSSCALQCSACRRTRASSSSREVTGHRPRSATGSGLSSPTTTSTGPTSASTTALPPGASESSSGTGSASSEDDERGIALSDRVAQHPSSSSARPSTESSDEPRWRPLRSPSG